MNPLKVMLAYQRSALDLAKRYPIKLKAQTDLIYFTMPGLNSLHSRNTLFLLKYLK
jgi:hypothetical protein